MAEDRTPRPHHFLFFPLSRYSERVSTPGVSAGSALLSHAPTIPSSAGTEARFPALENYLYICLLSLAFIAPVCGLFGVFFRNSILSVTLIRTSSPWLLYLLPLAGLGIAALYKRLDTGSTPRIADLGTVDVLHSIHDGQPIPAATSPLIFLGTVITHLFGGSTGCEGASLLLGAGASVQVRRWIPLSEDRLRLIVLCGMASAFSPLLGTPLTAAVFVLEMVRPHRNQEHVSDKALPVCCLSDIIPCLVASYISYGLSSLALGLVPFRFTLPVIPEFSLILLIQLTILGIVLSLISGLFCWSLSALPKAAKSVWKSCYTRIFFGGIVVILLTLLTGSRDYNGTGLNIISEALSGTARPEAFLWKMALTSVTLAAGFRGGQIVPSFFVGATAGCTLAAVMGLDPCWGAAVGLIAVFCGVVKCPVTAVVLSLEVFGFTHLGMFLIPCAIVWGADGVFFQNIVKNHIFKK